MPKVTTHVPSVRPGTDDDERGTMPKVTTLRTISHADGRRRVHIIDRGDGTYGYREEYFSGDPDERCWVSLRQFPLTVCDSAERAEREARAGVPWLREAPSD